MSINMPKTIKEERLRWILPIYNKEVKLVDVAKVCSHSQRSLERWLSAYKKHKEEGLIPKSTRPKTNPNETPIRTKERIIELRKKTKKCALKLNRNRFKNLKDLEKKIKMWNEEYNNLEHCSLNGKTPNEMLELFRNTEPTNVYV